MARPVRFDVEGGLVPRHGARGGAADGIDYGAVSMAIRRFERRLASDRVLRRACAAVRRRLTLARETE